MEHISQVWVTSAAKHKAFNIQEMYMESLGITQMYGYLKPQEWEENPCTLIYTLARKIYEVCNLTVFHSSESREPNELSDLLLMQSRSNWYALFVGHTIRNFKEFYFNVFQHTLEDSKALKAT